MSQSFDYPPRPFDGVLAGVGQAERLARGALRHLRAGEVAPLLRALKGGPKGGPKSAPDRGGSGAEGPAAPPVLYLPAVAWSYRFQRPQHLARALARAGHPVLYVDGFLRSRLAPERSYQELGGGVGRLRVRIPGRPDPYRQPLDAAQAERVAETLIAGLRGARPAMILVQLPFWAELGRVLARRLEAPLVYDRIDLHSGFPGVPPEVEAVEARLIRHADLVCATAGLLAERPREVSPRVLLLPNGVELETFANAGLGRVHRPERGPGDPVRVGYVGALGPWFDSDALRVAARAFPAWSFRLAGRVEDAEVAALAELPNLETVGEIPFREVPAFLAGLDVALVPFRDLPLTRAVDPVKLYEALAVGLPVVARRLPETERWSEPLVYSYTSPPEFVEALGRAVERDDAEREASRRAAAARESWNHRAALLRETVASLPGCRSCLDWTRS